MSQPTTLSGPDFGQGIPLSSIPDAGVLAGHVDDTPVLLSRVDDALHAVSATCTHYGAPLGEGLVGTIVQLYLGSDLLLLGLGAYDLVTRGRLHPAYVAGVQPRAGTHRHCGWRRGRLCRCRAAA